MTPKFGITTLGEGIGHHGPRPRQGDGVIGIKTLAGNPVMAIPLGAVDETMDVLRVFSAT